MHAVMPGRLALSGATSKYFGARCSQIVRFTDTGKQIRQATSRDTFERAA
jgi:hypothetical protein